MPVIIGPKDIVTDGLILHLDASNPRSYSGSGTSWTDLSNNGYGGSLVGSTSYSTNPGRFDTNATTITQQSYLSTSSMITFLDGSEYTWDFFVKFRTSVQANFNSLIGRNTTNPWLSIFPTNTSGNVWNVRYRQNGGTFHNTSNINYDMVNNWGNIVLSVDTSRNVNVYLNGGFKETLNTTSTLFYVNIIGGGYLGGPNYCVLQGSIGSCRFYNRALSQKEIMQNYNSLQPRFI